MLERSIVILGLIILLPAGNARAFAGITPPPTPTEAAPGCCDLSSSSGGCSQIFDSSSTSLCLIQRGTVLPRYSCQQPSGLCAAPSPPPPSATSSLTSSPEPTLTPTVPPPICEICEGDCDQDAEVTVDELLAAIQVALGEEPVSRCEAADVDRDGSVVVNEILQAVERALDGCTIDQNTFVQSTSVTA